MPTQNTVTSTIVKEGKTSQPVKKYRSPTNAKERLLAKMAKTKGFGVKARMYNK